MKCNAHRIGMQKCPNIVPPACKVEGLQLCTPCAALYLFMMNAEALMATLKATETLPLLTVLKCPFCGHMSHLATKIGACGRIDLCLTCSTAGYGAEGGTRAIV